MVQVMELLQVEFSEIFEKRTQKSFFEKRTQKWQTLKTDFDQKSTRYLLHKKYSRLNSEIF